MKLINSIALGLAAASTIFFIGCAADTAKIVPESELGYGSVSLDDNSVKGTPGTKYSSAAPGTSKRIKRAFQDAPPMIPHSVDGMLPITQNNNQCIGCHVDAAPYDKTIPSVPVSHMTNFRPNSKAVSGVNTSSESLANVSIKKLNHLYQGRFNCSQCHAPQAQGVDLITDSKFQPEFTAKDGAFKSSWDETKFMEDIDTTK
jgi:cytochrome c-type protein NapB